jgi:hypothetical protein
VEQSADREPISKSTDGRCLKTCRDNFPSLMERMSNAVLQTKPGLRRQQVKEIDPRLFFHGFYWFEKGLYFLKI